MDFLRFVQAVKKLRESFEGPIATHCLCAKLCISKDSIGEYTQCWNSNGSFHADGDSTVRNGSPGAHLSSGDCAGNERNACPDPSECSSVYTYWVSDTWQKNGIALGFIQE